MIDTPNAFDDHDDLEALLTPQTSSRDDDALKATILRETARQLRSTQRWRIVWRTGLRVSAALLLFASGLVSGWFLKPTETITLPAPEPIVITVPAPVPVPGPALPQPEASPSAVPTETAQQLELKAELADDRQIAAKFYRMAGDRYLNDLADYGQAARCYRLHLNAAGPEGRAVAVDDEWLLMSLKIAHRTENKNANRPGS